MSIFNIIVIISDILYIMICNENLRIEGYIDKGRYCRAKCWLAYNDQLQVLVRKIIVRSVRLVKIKLFKLNHIFAFGF